MITIIVGVATCLLFVLQREFYRRFWNKNLNVKLYFGQEGVFTGESGKIFEVIENKKHLPLPMVKVKFQCSKELKFPDVKGSSVSDRFYRNDIFTVMPNRRITRELTFIGSKRGYFGVVGVDLVGADLFLSQSFMESRGGEAWIYVYPTPLRSPAVSMALQKLNGDVIAKRHLLDDPFEYKGIREYQVFDEMKSINWKATAKTGDLKVNEKNSTSLNAVRIFLNLEDTGIHKNDDWVEASIRIAATVAQNFLEQGIKVSLFANSVDIITGEMIAIRESCGKAHMGNIYKALARLDTAKPAIPYGKSLKAEVDSDTRGCMTVFISPNFYPDFQQELMELKKKKTDFVCYLVRSKKDSVDIPTFVQKEVSVFDISGEVLS